MANGWGCIQDVGANATDKYIKSGAQPLKGMSSVLADSLFYFYDPLV